MPTAVRFIAIVALAAPICGCVFTPEGRIVSLEQLIVYQPAGPHPSDWQPPGLKYEDVYFEAPDGTELFGWYCVAEKPRAVVLYLHGNGGNITYTWPDLRLISERLQATVFAFDYRGYGRSKGTPSERGLLMDARAARRWLADRASVAEQEIILYGRSLGGGVAVELAASDGAKALILESTFTSLPAVANDALPLWPGLLMFNRYNSLSKIADYHGPLLLAHGDTDEIVPFEHGQALFAAANEPKQFVRIPKGDHNWAPTQQSVEALDAFITSLADE
jgi:fermentation-respiration switch protein FrsA (DUF1100 family)